MTKYDALINVLDQLRFEAPPENSRYYPLETDRTKVDQARSRAFIHLFLKVSFGLVDFADRERVVTDGKADGGIDAYFIDSASKTIYIIQSKFRSNNESFRNKKISLDELLSMDVARITEGEDSDENGTPYNGKIRQFQRELGEINDIGKFRYEIVILANLKETHANKLRKFTGDIGACEVFDYERTFRDLLFPIIAGTYYNHEELRIHLNLNNKTTQGARVGYNVNTEFVECEISVLFVPTFEIATTLYKYKNSILKYNPRSYLELSNNAVNQEIARTITRTKTNEFALFNNGITMLSYDTEFNDRVGQKHKAQLVITQPQIINGGQTAYTLSRIYEDNLSRGENNDVFDDKEVLLKVITLPNDPSSDRSKHLQLIEAVSKATNQQTPVEEADRRSNDKIQIELQEALFNTFGYFYERKKGEYADGVQAGYIDESLIIDRGIFLRIANTCDGNPAAAKRSDRILFRERNFVQTLNDVNRHIEYFFGYKCYMALNSIAKKHARDKANKDGIALYGNALRYGRYAVVAGCMYLFSDLNSLDQVDRTVGIVLGVWRDFESHIASLTRNKTYFYKWFDPVKNTVVSELNFTNYYKGYTLDRDVEDFFTAKQPELLQLLKAS